MDSWDLAPILVAIAAGDDEVLLSGNNVVRRPNNDSNKNTN